MWKRGQLSYRGTILTGLLCIALSLPMIARAQDQLRHFVAGSYADIVLQHQQTPFVLVLWSIDCPPCYEELTLLGQLHKVYPGFKVVLVATDGLEAYAEVAALISEKGLLGMDAWIFTDGASERLRFEIDRHWYGELPRSYFFSRAQPRQAISGRLSQTYVMAWLAENNILQR